MNIYRYKRYLIEIDDIVKPCFTRTLYNFRLIDILRGTVNLQENLEIDGEVQEK